MTELDNVPGRNPGVLADRWRFESSRAHVHAVPLWPWVINAGKTAIKHGVYVYEAEVDRIVLGASNGSLAGIPLKRYYLWVSREAIETAYIDLVDYAAREIREAVDAGYVMR